MSHNLNSWESRNGAKIHMRLIWATWGILVVFSGRIQQKMWICEITLIDKNKILIFVVRHAVGLSTASSMQFLDQKGSD